MEQQLEVLEPVVRSIANKLWDRVPCVRLLGSKHDAYQIGRIAAYKSIGRYDPNIGASLKNFAAYRIKGAILDEARKAELVKIPRRVMDSGAELKKAYCQSEAEPNAKSKISDYFYEDKKEIEVQDSIGRFLKSLTEQSRQIVTRYFGLGMPSQKMKQIAAELNLSESRISIKLEEIKEYARNSRFLLEAL